MCRKLSILPCDGVLGSLLLISAVLIVGYAFYKKGFLRIPQSSHVQPLIPRSVVASTLFALIFYFAVCRLFLQTSIIATVLSPRGSIFLGLFCLIVIYILYQTTAKQVIKAIWKDRSIPSAQSIASDIRFGSIFVLGAFPLVCATGTLFSSIILFISRSPLDLPTPLIYIIQSLHSPGLLTTMIVFIVVIAPLIEEFLFRGILLNAAQKGMGLTKANLFISVVYALFHFMPHNGLINISTLALFFVLSTLLNFIYQKTRSLPAPIALHVTYNALVVILTLIFE